MTTRNPESNEVRLDGVVRKDVIAMKSKHIVPVIAVPHQKIAVIWWDRPSDDPESDGHDLYAILESRGQAEAYVDKKGHQAERVASLIDVAWPK
jgi:hypothetical protein